MKGQHQNGVADHRMLHYISSHQPTLVPSLAESTPYKVHRTPAGVRGWLCETSYLVYNLTLPSLLP